MGNPRRFRALLSAVLLATLALGGFGPASGASFYAVQSLVSDGTVAGTTTDTNLKNGWGIVFSPSTNPSNGSPAWVANNHTGTSTVYNGDGTIVSLVVTIPTRVPRSLSPAPSRTRAASTDASTRWCS